MSCLPLSKLNNTPHTIHVNETQVMLPNSIAAKLFMNASCSNLKCSFAMNYRNRPDYFQHFNIYHSPKQTYKETHGTYIDDAYDNLNGVETYHRADSLDACLRWCSRKSNGDCIYKTYPDAITD